MAQRYPTDFSDKDLKDKIVEYADHPIERDNLSIAKYTKAIVGLTELQGRENKRIANLTLTAAILALLISGYGVWLTNKQTNYAEIQSIPDRINQARSVRDAIELCKQSPELKESGLFEVSSGKPASCAQVLETYEKDNSTWSKVKSRF